MYNSGGITIKCKCAREGCTDEIKVVPVKIDGEWSVMIHAAPAWAWGTQNVVTACLDATDREALSVIFAHPAVFADET